MARARLPPLNAIKAFEAAARLGSFTRAAEELSVTHGAVSRQIRLLEEWLGTASSCARAVTPCRRGRGWSSRRGRTRARPAGGCLSACPERWSGPRSAPHISASNLRDALADPASARTSARTSRAGNADRHREHAGRAVPHGCRCRDLGTVAPARLGWQRGFSAKHTCRC